MKIVSYVYSIMLVAVVSVSSLLRADYIKIYNATNAPVTVSLVQLVKPVSAKKIYAGAKAYGLWEGTAMVRTIEPGRYTELERPSYAKNVDTVILYHADKESLLKSIDQGIVQDGVLSYKVGQVVNKTLFIFSSGDGIKVGSKAPASVRQNIPSNWYKNDGLKSQGFQLQVGIGPEKPKSM